MRLDDHFKAPDGFGSAARTISRNNKRGVRLTAPVVHLTQQQDQDDQGNRNADQPEENGHVVFLSSFEGLSDGSAAPCAVAEAATFGRGQAGAKCSNQ